MKDRSYYLTIAALFALALVDVTIRGGQDLLFLVRKLFDLMDYLIFWR